MGTIAEGRARDQYVRQQAVEWIRNRIKAGPPGWEDITGHGYAYHETLTSVEVDWIMAILDELLAADEQAKADRVRDQLTKALR